MRYIVPYLYFYIQLIDIFFEQKSRLGANDCLTLVTLRRGDCCFEVRIVLRGHLTAAATTNEEEAAPRVRARTAESASRLRLDSVSRSSVDAAVTAAANTPLSPTHIL